MPAASALRSPEKLIDDLAVRNGSALELATIVSIASRIEPELLRSARLAILPTADASAEADLWLSPLMRTRGALFAVMRTDVAEILRGRLRADDARLADAWAVLSRVHHDAPPALVVEEEITWRTLVNPHDNEIQNLFGRVSAALDDHQRLGLARWATRAVPELPAEARHSAAAWDVSRKASALIGFALVAPAESSAVPGGSANAPLPADLPRVDVGLRLFSDSLRVSNPPEPGSGVISVPSTNPLLLLIEWEQAGQTERRVVSLLPRSSQVVSGVGTTGLRVTTAGSECFGLQLSQDRERISVSRIVSQVGALTVCAYVGDHAVLLAFDVERSATKDLLGFAVARSVGGGSPVWLQNALSFAGSSPAPSIDAPFQRFRWIHMTPMEEEETTRQYRICAMYGRPGELQARTEVMFVVGPPPLSQTIQIGFTNPYEARPSNAPDSDESLRPSGRRSAGPEMFDTGPYQERYRARGAAAHQLMFNFIDECVQDSSSEAHVLAFDIDHPDIIRRFISLGPRLTILLDDSPLHAKQPTAALLSNAGCNVVRFHFRRFSHSKCIIRLVGGKPTAVLTGSVNFSINSLYSQSNHIIVIRHRAVANSYEGYFQNAIHRPKSAAVGKSADQRPGLPGVRVLFSPSRAPIDALVTAIRQAKSSILFSLMADSASEIIKALQTARTAGVLVEGVLHGNKTMLYWDGIQVMRPLSRSSAGQGKFVVIDFNADQATVFAGSSNFSAGGALANGDNVVAIQSGDIATQFAIEAFKTIDRHRFRATAPSRRAVEPLSLRPTDQWLERYFRPGTIHYQERTLLVGGARSDDDARTLRTARKKSKSAAGKTKQPASKKRAGTGSGTAARKAMRAAKKTRRFAKKRFVKRKLR